MQRLLFLSESSILSFYVTMGVTFLCPNKKVTKEVVRGEELRANRILAPDPTPAAPTTAH